MIKSRYWFDSRVWCKDKESRIKGDFKYIIECLENLDDSTDGIVFSDDYYNYIKKHYKQNNYEVYNKDIDYNQRLNIYSTSDLKPISYSFYILNIIFLCCNILTFCVILYLLK